MLGCSALYLCTSLNASPNIFKTDLIKVTSSGPSARNLIGTDMREILDKSRDLDKVLALNTEIVQVATKVWIHFQANVEHK